METILTITTIILSYSLVPQVIKSIRERSVKISLQTLIVSSVGVWTLSVCFLIMGLTFNGLANSLGALLWSILLLMKLIWDKP